MTETVRVLENGAIQASLQRLVDSLLILLTRETFFYQELLAIVYREKEGLYRPSVELIDEINEKKEKCILELQKLEASRAKVVRELAIFFNTKEAVINISYLLPYLPIHKQEDLLAAQKILLPLISDIKKINDRNRDILDDSLSRVDASLNFIKGLKAMKAGYSKFGRIGNGCRSGVLVRGEV